MMHRSDPPTELRSNVRRMVITFVVVLLVADLAARVVGAAFPEPSIWYHDIAQAKARQLVERKGESLDMVFAGTSQTYYGVDVAVIDRALGTTSYNAGVPAGVPPIQERWLPRQVLRRVDTDLVVWGVSLLDLNDGRDLSVVSAYDEAYATRKGFLADLDRGISRWSGLFRHRRQLTDPEVWRQAFKGEDPMAASRAVLRDDGVRVPGDRRPTERQRQRMEDRIVVDYEVGTKMLASLRSTIERVQDRGTDVVLAWLPVPERLLELLPEPGLQAAARRRMRDFAHEVGVTLIDLSDGFTNDDFLDYTHLGPTGAARLSLRMAAALRSDVGTGST